MAVDRQDLKAIPALVMLRRLLLVGWFATHTHTTEYRTIGPAFVPQTVALAERFLAGRYLRGLA